MDLRVVVLVVAVLTIVFGAGVLVALGPLWVIVLIVFGVAWLLVSVVQRSSTHRRSRGDPPSP
jgi:hypothetical protein